MNQRKKFFLINFNNNNVRYEGTIEVMSSNRTGGGPTVRVHFEIIIFDLLKPKKLILNKLLKKQTAYKKLGKFSTRGKETIEISISKDSHNMIIQDLKESVINMDPILFEIKIEPILEEIKKEYRVERTTYAYP